MARLVYFGVLTLLVYVSCTYAGAIPHGYYGHKMQGGPVNNKWGFHGSSMHNFYPGDWGNNQHQGNMGTYQFSQYNPQSGNFWNQVLGGSNWNQPGNNWNQNGWNAGMQWQGDQGWNNNLNNGWNNNFNNGWNSNLNNGWNNNLNNGWNGNLNNGWNNNLNNGWNNNVNNGWNNFGNMDAIAIQSH